MKLYVDRYWDMDGLGCWGSMWWSRPICGGPAPWFKSLFSGMSPPFPQNLSKFAYIFPIFCLMFLFYQQKINKKIQDIQFFRNSYKSQYRTYIRMYSNCNKRYLWWKGWTTERERERESHGHIMCFSILQLAFIPWRAVPPLLSCWLL